MNFRSAISFRIARALRLLALMGFFAIGVLDAAGQSPSLPAVQLPAQLDDADASPTPTSTNPSGGSSLTLNIGLPGSDDPKQIAIGLQILALLSVLTLAPAILMMLTSFTRIAVVLGFVRRALGTQEVPPTQILIGLALFLTFFVMAPTWSRVYEEALKPYFEEEITIQEAWYLAEVPTRDFLFSNTRVNDLALFVNMSGIAQPGSREDIPTYILVPAFMISELQTAFLIGFIIYVPFLIIDMVVSSILLSMGMMMLPPVIVSLPFKIILFVLVDGWGLVIGSLVRSFGS